MRIKIMALGLVMTLGTSLLQAEINQGKIREWKSVTLSNGITKEWESITRITDTGFTFMTSNGVGNVKFADLNPEQQKEIGYDPVAAATPPAATGTAQPAAPANPGAYFDQAIKQAAAQQTAMRAEIAQMQAEVARSKAVSPNSSTQTLENQIKRREAQIKIAAQEGKVLQEQKLGAMVGATTKPTGNAQVDAAVARANSVKVALAQKKIKKQQVILEQMQSELLQPGGSNTYQSQLGYIERDLTALQAEVKAADANVAAVRAAQQVR